MLLPKTTNLLTLFLSLEIMSISLYVLAGFKKEEGYSIEAGFKYLILGIFASAFLLYGVSLLYGAFGTTELSLISAAVDERASFLIFAGLAFITLGLGFKLAFVPFHMWSPDVYLGSPVPIAAFISTGSKVAIFAVFLKVYMTFMPLGESLMPALWLISVLTMTVGNITALMQDYIKRMLAFSSIAHMGYTLIAVLSFDELGSSALVFNLLAYVLMNLGAFGVVTVLSREEEDFSLIEGYRGLWSRNPWLSAVMAISLISLAGIPPTAGFMGKFYIFSAAIKSGFIGIVLIGVLNSVIALYYYLRIVVLMYSESTGLEGRGWSAYDRLALGLVTFGTLAIGIYPGPAIKVIQNAVQNAFNF
jgi:NADH-quinone oxidoreductase subunit N